MGWEPVAETYFDRYEIYISTDETVNTEDLLWSAINDPDLAVMSTAGTTANQLDSGTYWAAIRIIDTEDNSSTMSPVISFTLSETNPPVLSNPLPGGQPAPAWSQVGLLTIGCTITDESDIDYNSLYYRVDLNQNGSYDPEEQWTQINLRSRGKRNSRNSIDITVDLNLEEDGYYAWEIQAADIHGTIGFSGTTGDAGIEDDWIVRVDTAPPEPMDNFFVQAVSSDSATLYWSASYDLRFSGYRVYFSTSTEPGTEDMLWDGNDDPNLYYAGSGLVSTTITGLDAATRYYFLLQATDEAGWITPYPNVITAMTSSEYQSMTPQQVTINTQDNLLSIDWEAVTQDVMANPIGISYYEVHVSDQPYFECSFETLLQRVYTPHFDLEGPTEIADKLFFRIIAVSGSIRQMSEAAK